MDLMEWDPTDIDLMEAWWAAECTDKGKFWCCKSLNLWHFRGMGGIGMGNPMIG
jgi:hypothetical protein